jgi:hypothetical protein
MAHANTPIADRPGPLSRRLALLAQWGIEDVPCRPARQPEPPCDDEFLALPAAQDLRYKLVPHADLLAHRCRTPAGMLGLPLRLLRGLFKVVIGPWLDMQTRFNQAVVQALLHEQASSRTYLEQLSRHVRNQRAVLDDFAERLDRDLASLGQMQRLSIRHVIETLEQRSHRLAPPPSGNGAAPRALEQVFLQTWLPRPPARLLAVGGEDEDALELSDLGYQVVADNRLTPDNGSEPAYPNGGFDAVVWLARSGAGRGLLSAFQCLLRSGGRAVVRLTLDESVPQALPADFRLLEAAFAVAEGHDWTYTTDAAVVASLRARGASGGIALIAAEKQ